MISKILKTIIVINVQITKIVCSRYGIIIKKKIFNSLAPSILDASIISFGMLLSAALKITNAKPV